MNIWLFKISEPIPDDIDLGRTRMPLLINSLVRRGHKVIWFASKFDHAKKLHRNDLPEEINCNSNAKIILADSPGYKSNVGFRRYFDHLLIAKKILKLSKKYDIPDKIVVAMPDVQLAYKVARYAKKKNIPYICDVRDPWPDSFLYLTKNKFLRAIIKLLIIPDSLKLKYILKNAESIVSVSEGMLEWAKSKIREEKKAKTFFLASCPKIPIQLERSIMDKLKSKYSDYLSKDYFKVFFAASWGKFTHPTFLLEIARILEGINLKIIFIICGDGPEPYESKINKLAKRLKNVLLTRRIPWQEAFVLGKLCDVGITFFSGEASEYNDKLGFTIPNRIFSLFASGLPILNGMGVKNNISEISKYISKFGLGENFQTNDVETVSRKIIKLYSNKQLLKEYKNNVGMFYEKFFSPNLVYNDYVSFIESE